MIVAVDGTDIVGYVSLWTVQYRVSGTRQGGRRLAPLEVRPAYQRRRLRVSDVLTKALPWAEGLLKLLAEDGPGWEVDMAMASKPKPSHHSAAYGAWFRDPLVAEAYPTRPPYPDEVLSLLTSLIAGNPERAAVLDLGAGTGDLARRLTALVARVDAIDASEAMMRAGQHLPGGDNPRLRWILGMAEEAPLAPPYALATAGESLHWMDWDVVLPRVAAALAPGAVLAIVNRNWDGPPTLRERLVSIFTRYSPVSDYRPYDMIAELTSRGLFAELGRQRCGPAPWTPTVAEYIECRHSQRAASRTHMGPEAVAGFDTAIAEVLEELCRDGTLIQEGGRLHLQVVANVVWGRPA